MLSSDAFHRLQVFWDALVFFGVCDEFCIFLDKTLLRGFFEYMMVFVLREVEAKFLGYLI